MMTPSDGQPKSGELLPEAHALSAFRAVPGGGCRAYTATWFPNDPRGGIDRMLRMARACGFVGSADYAVLDVLGENGDIVQDFGIPTAGAFRWWKRKLNLAVESEDKP